jgi:hypothetical protein
MNRNSSGGGEGANEKNLKNLCFRPGAEPKNLAVYRFEVIKTQTEFIAPAKSTAVGTRQCGT